MKADCYLPERLEFFRGGWDCPDATNLKFEDGVLWHGQGPVVEKPSGKMWTRCDVTEKQWQQFWQAVERIGVWDWQAYYDSDVLDGAQWSLEMEFGDRRLEAEGSNAYPGAPGPDFPARCAFGQFLAALRRLTGIKNI